MGEGTATLKGSLENVAKNEAKRIAVFTNLQFKGFGEKDWSAEGGEAIGGRCKNGCQRLENLQKSWF
jgi:hypothetical protein